MPTSPFLTRRVAAAALVVAPALLLGVRGQQAKRRATPAQTEGPFYPVQLPADQDADLLRTGNLRYEDGEPATVGGTLTDLEGRPLAGSLVEIWQCDAQGHYHHPGDGNRAAAAFQGFGRVQTDAQGRWRFRTIRPVAYSGRTPHIHVKVRAGRREVLTTQLYVEGDPHNARDGIWRQLSPEDRAAVTA
ncbi:MAG: intradiol ring-cleavage dioxygenase, partial [Ramlibacter sp.]